MNRPERINDYLEHILEASENIFSYTSSFTLEDFYSNKQTQQAVVMNLIIIGEAATKLMDKYPGFTDANSHISWLGMRGMRNRIAHGYFEIDLNIVWQTITKAIPELVNQIESLN